MQIVIDTNVLVSSLWSPRGTTSQVLDLLFSHNLTPCFDQRILEEYRAVLQRPKFHFNPDLVGSLLLFIQTEGFEVIAPPIAEVFLDPSDKKFLEVARACACPLVTGNLKQFPRTPEVLSVQDLLLAIPFSC